jgi:hypothetical protein
LARRISESPVMPVTSVTGGVVSLGTASTMSSSPPSTLTPTLPTA